MKRRTLAALVLAVASFGCSSEAGGPRYVALGVRVTSSDARVLGTLCTRLPVLLGSHVLDRVDVDGRFELVVRGDREGADVAFEGALNAEDLARSLSLSELDGGYTETLEVEVRDRTYEATLTAGCSTSGAED